MPYIGRGLEKGNYLKLDDISSQFDGSKTTFNLTVGGSAHVPGSSYSLLVSLSGIIQEGEAAYTLDQNQITFAAAPQAVDDCYIISLGTPIGIGVPGDGTVSGPQFAKPFNYENFFYLDHTTQRVGIGTTVPTQSLDVYDGNIAIRDPATASQFLGFYHNRNVLKASIDKTGNNLTFENVDSGIIDFKNNGSSRVGIGSTGKIFFASDDDTYFYRPGADTLGFLVGDDEKLRINGDRVIIGLSDSNNLPTFNASTTFANVYTNNPGAFNAIAILGGHSTGAAFVKFGDRDNERQGQIGYYNQDDSMRFFVNGDTTDKVRIDSDGKVGIGSQIPQEQLDVTAGGVHNAVFLKTSSDKSLIEFENNVGSTYNTRIGSATLGSGNVGLMFETGTSSSRLQAMVIDRYGKVGIGTQLPDTLLHVYGSSATEKLITLAGGDTKRNNYIGINGSDNLEIAADEDNEGGDSSIRFRIDGDERLRITSGGQTTIKSTANQPLILNNTNANGQSSISFQSAGSTKYNLGSNKDGDGNIDFFIYDQVNGKHRFNIKADGKTGIGTDDPLQALDVIGVVKADNLSVAGVSTFTGSITAPDIITAGALLHEGDTNTLIHFSAADTIQLKTGGTSKLLVNNFGINLENGDLNTNGNRIIVGDSSGATDDRLVLGNTNDLQLYHNASDSYIENATGVLKILGDIIQLGEGTDKVGIGTTNPDKKLTVYGGVGIDGTHATQVTLDVDNRVGMANTAGSEQLILNLRGDVANDSQLVFKNYRLRNGANWTTSTFRIQRKVDTTEMGYIDFGTGSGSAGRDIQLGNGNGTVYMHFDSSQGHVGIGTTAPRQKFEVIGTIANGRPTFQHESGYGGLQIAGPAMGSGASLFFTRGYASSGTGTTTFSLFMAGGDQSLNFVAGDASEYLTKTKMMIENNGFVGIGTRNPDDELHVYGTASDPTIFLENGATGSSSDTIIKCGIGGTIANNYIYFGDPDDSNVGQIRYNHGSDFMTFTTNGDERVRIFNDGRMNIGGTNEVQLTTNSTAVLHLNGAIVGANIDAAFGTRIIMDDDDTGTTSGGDRERGSILAQFNGNASGGNTTDECRLWNIHSDVNCTADYDNVYGVYSDVRTTHTSGTCSAMRGVYGITQRQGSGNVTDMVGIYGISQNTNSSSGNINDIVAGKFKANQCTGNGTGTATDLVGVWAVIDNDAETSQPTGGKCALFYGNYDKVTNLHNPQGIRIDTNVPNYFRGGLAIGQSSNTIPTGKLDVAGDVNVTGTLTKGTNNFRIPHPLVGLTTTKDLVHSVIEGPQLDLIYRGKVDLVGGTATINIDTKAGMTEGTFVALCRDIQCFTSNETGWTAVKGSVTGNKLTIIAQDNSCTDTISWMVVGERQDDNAKGATCTDNDGNLILEPDKRTDLNDKYQAECEKNEYNES